MLVVYSHNVKYTVYNVYVGIIIYLIKPLFYINI